MTNYNDGEWHGWNGGKCPVHRKTMVKVQLAYENRIYAADCTPICAGSLDWSGPDKLVTSHITNFRVIKEYHEPRDFWVNVYAFEKIAHETKESAENCASTSRKEIIHVREVLE